MIALGWTMDTLPEGVISFPCHDVTLAAAEASSPRDALAQQGRLARLGVDLLPLSPGRMTSVDEALAHPPTSVGARLATLRGQVQVTLHLGWSAPEASTVDGRAWLQSRRARLARARDAESWLTRLATDLALPAAPVETRVSSAILHLLLPRGRDLPALTPPPGHCLTLTGPWPPLAFAQAS